MRQTPCADFKIWQTVSLREAATDGEIYSLIDEYILNTEWNYTFQDMGVIPEDYFFKNMDTDHISIKRYILYDEKLSDGVAIMAYDICMP